MTHLNLKETPEKELIAALNELIKDETIIQVKDTFRMPYPPEEEEEVKAKEEVQKVEVKRKKVSKKGKKSIAKSRKYYERQGVPLCGKKKQRRK